MPAFAFMRGSEQGPSWFARSLGSLRLTKRSGQDAVAAHAGGIPMARFGWKTVCGLLWQSERASFRVLTLPMRHRIGRGAGPEMIPVARIGKRDSPAAAAAAAFEQIPMARLGKRDAFSQIPMARVGRGAAFNQIPMARVGRDAAFQQIPMARLGRSSPRAREDGD